MSGKAQCLNGGVSFSARRRKKLILLGVRRLRGASSNLLSLAGWLALSPLIVVLIIFLLLLLLLFLHFVQALRNIKGPPRVQTSCLRRAHSFLRCARRRESGSALRFMRREHLFCYSIKVSSNSLGHGAAKSYPCCHHGTPGVGERNGVWAHYQNFWTEAHFQWGHFESQHQRADR